MAVRGLNTRVTIRHKLTDGQADKNRTQFGVDGQTSTLEHALEVWREEGVKNLFYANYVENEDEPGTYHPPDAE